MTRYHYVLGLLIVIVCALLTLGATPTPFGNVYLQYDEFIDKVRNGEVVSVELDEFSGISGILRSGDVETPFHTFHGDPPNDPLLQNLLSEHSVSVHVQEEQENPLFGAFYGFAGFFLLILPILTFVYAVRIHSKVKRILKTQGELILEPVYEDDPMDVGEHDIG